MLDFVLLAKIVLAGALVAAVVLWVSARRSPPAWRTSACWSWAIGVGVLAASGTAGHWPQWPALEDRARFLTLIVPLTLLVETLAATAARPVVAWIVRAGLAASVAPILLYDSVYVTDWNGHGSAEWTSAEAGAVLVGIAVLLTMVWWALSRLQARTSAQAVAWVLVIDALAVGLVVMLSGYYGAGLLGLGLAASLAGAALAAIAVLPSSSRDASLGMGVIGIFCVVIVGRFFGSLSTGMAACLLLAPFLAWILELPRLRKLAPRWRTAGRLACVAVPLAVALCVAQRQFAAKSNAGTGPSPSSETRAGR